MFNDEGKSFLMKGMNKQEQDHLFCVETLKQVKETNPNVIFLLNALKRAKCPIGESFIKCKPCNGKEMAGSFEPEGIIICEDKLQNKNHVKDILTHELIHAFDYCRKEFDLNNCRHQLCSEIRAASLSGDCSWFKEVLRGHYKTFSKQHQNCVKRRALLSISASEGCSQIKDKEGLIEELFETCFKDTLPFVEIP